MQSSRMAEPKKGRGCFFYGCLSVIVLVALLGIAAFVAYGFAKRAFTNQTSPTGIAIAPIKLPMREGEDAIKRVDDFSKDLQEGKAVKPLVLTSDEVDYYLRSMPGGAPFHDRMHFTVTNNHVEGEFSFPLGAMMPGMKVNGFLNGKANFKVNVHDGTLVADVDSMEVNGKPVSGWLENMRKNFKFQPSKEDRTGKLFNNLDRVEIEDDKLILFPKTDGAPAPEVKKDSGK
jgi:hypothetical protein